MKKRINTAFCIAVTVLIGANMAAQAEEPDGSSKGLSAEKDTGTGQAVTSSNEGGGVFMDEVVDPKQQAREVEQLRKPVKLNRRALTPEELSNVGVQMEPSGRIVPLLAPNATSPVQQYGTQMSTYTEFPYGVVVPNPYTTGPLPPYGPYGAPYPVPFPYARPGINIGVGTPLNVSGSNTQTVTPTQGGGVQFGNSGKIITGPSVQGGLNINPYGGITGGARLGLPTVTEYESTTTVTPILPQLPPPTPPDSN